MKKSQNSKTYLCVNNLASELGKTKTQVLSMIISFGWLKKQEQTYLLADNAKDHCEMSFSGHVMWSLGDVRFELAKINSG